MLSSLKMPCFAQRMRGAAGGMGRFWARRNPPGIVRKLIMFLFKAGVGKTGIDPRLVAFRCVEHDKQCRAEQYRVLDGTALGAKEKPRTT